MLHELLAAEDIQATVSPLKLAIFDFDRTITSHPTFDFTKLTTLPDADSSVREPEERDAYLKPGVVDVLRRYQQSHSLAIASYHNNPDFIAQRLANALGVTLSRASDFNAAYEKRIIRQGDSSVSQAYICMTTYEIETGGRLYISTLPINVSAEKDDYLSASFFVSGKNDQVCYLVDRVKADYGVRLTAIDFFDNDAQHCQRFHQCLRNKYEAEEIIVTLYQVLDDFIFRLKEYSEITHVRSRLYSEQASPSLFALTAAETLRERVDARSRSHDTAVRSLSPLSSSI